ncbi:hypothetical protein [Rugamonas apoptosis]|uniref:Uncharacterized protein n=1 Tax=Rugamonas apoptosis TaxID=2758570 RepID=A0A7W2IL73_9BURK|nr:hypothetical protein [Rugamonas apoptosis]MBA5688141.1 hypothetical protein [Rugamonas apoptosis]
MHIRANLCPIFSIFGGIVAASRGFFFHAFASTPFQSRKVHENLVGAQQARKDFASFFYRIGATTRMRLPIRSRRARRRYARMTLRWPQRSARGRDSQLIDFKPTLMPIGCLRFRLRRSELTARAVALRLRAKLVLHTVFKFVAIMRHSSALGKDNAAAVRASARMRGAAQLNVAPPLAVARPFLAGRKTAPERKRPDEKFVWPCRSPSPHAAMVTAWEKLNPSSARRRSGIR